MKKGLLSLLAVALTIVSCQDYDEQFAELTGLVTTLSTKVAGIETATANLAALSVTVNGLQASIAAIPLTDSTADLTATGTSLASVLEGLETAQTEIDAIKLLLAGGVASSAELTAINSLIDDVQAGVNTLLTNNQSISVNITIVDTETLATAQGYIEVASTVSGSVDTTPAGYLLGGSLLVDHDGLTPAQIITANAMTKKLISVSGTVSITGAVDLSGLSYIAGNYTKNGSLSPVDATITSLGANLSVDGQIRTITFPNLNSVIGNVVISNLASVTSIDFSNVTTVGAGSTINSPLTVASATSVNLGGFKASVITANDATSVILGQTTAHNLTINAATAASVVANSLATATGTIKVSAVAATLIEMNALTSAAAELEITAANSTTVVKFNKLTSTLILDADQVEVKEFHIPSFVVNTGPVAISAMTINAAGLKTLIAGAGNAVTLASGSISAPVFSSLLGPLTITAGSNGIQNVNFPSLVVATGATLTAAVTSVTVASAAANLSNILRNAANVTCILTAQTVNVVGVNTGRADFITTLSITGSMTYAATGATPATSFTHNVTEMSLLKYLTVSNMANVIIPTTSLIGTMTTAGKITSLSIVDADLMSSLTVGHGPHTYNNAPAQTVIINANAELKAVDLSTVTKAMLVDIGSTRLHNTTQRNVKLASIIAPASSTLNANAAVAIHIQQNALVATSTAIVVGTSPAEVWQPSLTSWKDYIGLIVAAGTVNIVSDAYAVGSGSVTHTIDYDFAGNGATVNTFATNTAGFIAGSGVINLPSELATIDANVTGR